MESLIDDLGFPGSIADGTMDRKTLDKIKATLKAARAATVKADVL